MLLLEFELHVLHKEFTKYFSPRLSLSHTYSLSILVQARMIRHSQWSL